jgi:predicted Zn-dependent protease
MSESRSQWAVPKAKQVSLYLICLFHAESKAFRTVLASCLILVLTWPLIGQSEDLGEKAHRAGELIAAGQPERAVPIYQELVRDLPGNPGLLLNLGMALSMAGRDQEAIKEFEAALKLKPHYPNALLFLAMAYLNLNQPRKAVAPLEEVVAGQPQNELARWKLGEVYYSLDNNSEAAKQFLALSRLNPRNPKAWYGLGRSYMSLSVSTSWETRHLEPDSGYAWALFADSYTEEHQYGAAFQTYRKAMERLPTLPGLHAAVADIYKRTGHPDWAAVEEERERQLGPPACSTQPRACDFQAGRYDELVAPAGPQATAETYYWQSKAYERMSVAAFARLSELPPSAEFHAIKAQADADHEEFRACVEELQEARKLSPDNPEIAKNLAIAYRRIGDQNNARTLLEELVKRQTGRSDVYYLLGDTLLSLHQPAQAIPYLKKALDLNPGLVDVHSSLGKAYLENGQAQEAIPHLQASLAKDDDGTLHYQLARAYQHEGQSARAAEMLKRYQEIRGVQTPEKRAPRIDPPLPLP